MSVYINFVCEHPDCKCAQPVHFTALSETFGGMVSYMRELGWVVLLEEAKAACVLCPYHARSADRAGFETP